MFRPAVLAICLAASSAAGAESAAARLERFLDTTKTLQAGFEQALYNAEGVLMETSRGKMYLQRPARFRWDYTEPYPQLVLADGEQVWTYDPELRQATVRPLQDVLAHTPGLLLGTDKSVTEDFKLTESGTHDGFDWVDLAPRNQGTQFARIRFGFEGSRLVEMQMVDTLDQLTRIRFIGQQLNTDLEAGLFSFRPGPDVDVLSGAENP